MTTVLEIANRELTPPQLEVWTLRSEGLSQREISYRLDLARTTVTDRLDAADRRLRKHGVKVTATGRYYLEETA